MDEIQDIKRRAGITEQLDYTVADQLFQGIELISVLVSYASHLPPNLQQRLQDELKRRDLGITSIKQALSMAAKQLGEGDK